MKWFAGNLINCFNANRSHCGTHKYSSNNSSNWCIIVRFPMELPIVMSVVSTVHVYTAECMMR